LGKAIVPWEGLITQKGLAQAGQLG